MGGAGARVWQMDGVVVRMMTIPNEIFAWLDVPKSKTDLPKGGWNTYSDMENIRFFRADLALIPEVKPCGT